MLRTNSDEKLNEFKKFSKIPIINGLSPSSHPTQFCQIFLQFRKSKEVFLN